MIAGFSLEEIKRKAYKMSPPGLTFPTEVRGQTCAGWSLRLY